MFCLAPKYEDGPENLIVHRGEFAYLILNRFPYTSGHLMVVPYEHHQNLEDFTPETRAEMIELTSQSIEFLRKKYNAQGFNVGANLGSAAGAGIPKHCHLHIVPRWEGDTNFMATIGETRVIPEAIEETYQRVKTAWKK